MLITLATLALAAPPTLICREVSVVVPAEDDGQSRPKGFYWEGFRPVAVLADGRAVLARASALERLSRSALKRQHEEDGPDRVQQIVLVKPNGTLDAVATMPRGTLLEVAAMPDGGVVIAETLEVVGGLDFIDSSGVWRGRTRLPENPQADRQWRQGNPLRGDAPPRLAPLDAQRVAVSYGGTAFAFDLVSHTQLGGSEVWALGTPTVFPKKGPGELVAVDRQARFLRYDADLNRAEKVECEGCRVVGLQRVVGLHDDGEGSSAKRWTGTVRPRLAAIAQPMGEAIEVRFIGASTARPEEAPVRVPIAYAEAGQPFTWRARTGPWGTALISVHSDGESGGDVVMAVQPGNAEPVWRWQAPADLVGRGQHVVADAVGPHLRLRTVSGEGPDERTHRAALVDLHTGVMSDWVTPAGLDPLLTDVMGNPWAAWHNAGQTALRVSGDPSMERMEPGKAEARFERCTVEVKGP